MNLRGDGIWEWTEDVEGVILKFKRDRNMILTITPPDNFGLMNLNWSYTTDIKRAAAIGVARDYKNRTTAPTLLFPKEN